MPEATAQLEASPATTNEALTASSRPQFQAVAATRNISVDAYRGFVMLLMMAEVLRLARVAHAFPGNWALQFLAFNQTHVDWVGCSLHDLIQPSFSFLVGVALPYSIASRVRRGQMKRKMLLHSVMRSFVLVALGIFLRSMHRSQTYFTFEDTLTQIGLGYAFLFLLGFRSSRSVWIAFFGILFGYWLAWALYPVAGAQPGSHIPGVPPNWTHDFSGFAAHWNKNRNFGTAVDQWFLNLFPRESPFVANDGGYLTLSFIPTLGTMILGLIAGRALKESTPAIPLRRLCIWGSACLAGGLVLHYTHMCPIVKRIWTPSWTLFSGGACFLLLAGFSWLIDVKGYRRWSFPLVVIGMNSIAAYLIAHLCEDFVTSSLRIHFGRVLFPLFPAGSEPLFVGLIVLFAYWLMLFWMYRNKVFLRI